MISDTPVMVSRSATPTGTLLCVNTHFEIALKLLGISLSKRLLPPPPPFPPQSSYGVVMIRSVVELRALPSMA